VQPLNGNVNDVVSLPVVRFDAGGTQLRHLTSALAAAIVMTGAASAQQNPWDDDPNVRAVLAQRRVSLEAMMAGTMSAETERYSTTFVANTPNNSVVPGDVLLELFTQGSISYDYVEQTIDYAGSHGPDVVVVMGEEIVVPGAGLANAGKRIVRRFTDVFRRENGEWRHDLRHANVLRIED
jgi:hypothetical protein